MYQFTNYMYVRVWSAYSTLVYPMQDQEIALPEE